MSVSFIQSGRFGNNFFQYLAAKVIGKYSNKTYVYKTNYNYKITDKTYIELYNDLKEGRKTINENITLEGYFIFIDWLKYEKEFILSLMTLDNFDKINDNVTVNNVVSNILKLDESLISLLKNPVNLVVHLRLDDFYHQGYNSEVICPRYLSKYINTLNFQKIIFVVDALKEDWEKNYINIILKEIPNSVIVSNTFLEDFSALYYSHNLMVARSTFGWVACVISPHNIKNFFPLHNNQFPSNIDEIYPYIDDNTVVFTPEYLKNNGGRNY